MEGERALEDHWNKGHEEEYPLNTKMLLEQLKEMESTYFSDDFGQSLNIKADYSPQSLKELERVLSLFSEGFKQNPPTMVVVALGYYFGETLRRNVPNVEWVHEQALDPSGLSLRVQQNNGYQEFKPIQRILNFFMDHEFGLYTVYVTMKKLQEGSLDLLHAKKNKKIMLDESNNIYVRVRKTIEIKK